MNFFKWLFGLFQKASPPAPQRPLAAVPRRPDIIPSYVSPEGTPRFEHFMPFIFKWENEYQKGHDGDLNYVRVENVPGDPGGATFAGIDHRSHPTFDFSHPTIAAAKKIYYDSYWNLSPPCEGMHPKLGEVVMNCRVNCGAHRAAQFAEVAGGDPAKFVDEQEAFYRRLAAAKPSSKKFLAGWLHRTQDLRRFLSI